MKQAVLVLSVLLGLAAVGGARKSTAAKALLARTRLQATLSSSKCAGLTSCNDCAAQPGCGWCSGSAEMPGRCTGGNAAGPFEMFADKSVKSENDPLKTFEHDNRCGDWRYAQCPLEDCSSRSTCGSCVRDVFCGWCPTSGKCQRGLPDGPLEAMCVSGWLHSPLSGDTAGDQAANHYTPVANVTTALHTMCQLNDRKEAARVVEQVNTEREVNSTKRESFMSCSPCTGTWPNCDCGGNDPLAPPRSLTPDQVVTNDEGEALEVSDKPAEAASEEEAALEADEEAADKVALLRAHLETAEAAAEALKYSENRTVLLEARRVVRMRGYAIRIARREQAVVHAQADLEAAFRSVDQAREGMAAGAEDKEAYAEAQRLVDSSLAVRAQAERDLANATAEVPAERVRVAREEQEALKREMELLAQEKELELLDELRRQAQMMALEETRAVADAKQKAADAAKGAVAEKQEELKAKQSEAVQALVDAGKEGTPEAKARAKEAHDAMVDAQHAVDAARAELELIQAEADVARLGIQIVLVKEEIKRREDIDARASMRADPVAGPVAAQDEMADVEIFGSDAEGDAEVVIGVGKDGSNPDESIDAEPAKSGAAAAAAAAADQVGEAPANAAADATNAVADAETDAEADEAVAEAAAEAADEGGEALLTALEKLAVQSPSHRLAVLEIMQETAQEKLDRAKQVVAAGGPACGKTKSGAPACAGLVKQNAAEYVRLQKIADLLNEVSEANDPGVAAALAADEHSKLAEEAKRDAANNATALMPAGEEVELGALSIRALRAVVARAKDELAAAEHKVESFEKRRADALMQGKPHRAEALAIHIRHAKRALSKDQAFLAKAETALEVAMEEGRAALAARAEAAAAEELAKAEAAAAEARTAEEKKEAAEAVEKAEEAVHAAEDTIGKVQERIASKVGNMSANERNETVVNLKAEAEEGKHVVDSLKSKQASAEEVEAELEHLEAANTTATVLKQVVQKTTPNDTATQAAVDSSLNELSSSISSLQDLLQAFSNSGPAGAATGGAAANTTAAPAETADGAREAAQAAAAALEEKTQKQKEVEAEVEVLESRVEKSPSDKQAVTALADAKEKLVDVAADVQDAQADVQQKQMDVKETEEAERQSVAALKAARDEKEAELQEAERALQAAAKTNLRRR